MDTKLIVDAGATKTRWVLLVHGKTVSDVTSGGFNPYYVHAKKSDTVFKEIVPEEVKQKNPDEIHFYGTGCSTAENCAMIHTLFKNLFPDSTVNVSHDMTGTAIALFGNSEGVASILGTGSNSCVWDGKQVIENVPSLGWLLGDQGSGTYLGKLILTHILSGKAGAGLQQAFYRYVGMDFKEVLQTLYQSEHPNRWIASLAKFAALHQDNDEIKMLIKKNFTDFYNEQLSRYPRIKHYNIGFTGSVAFHFQELLKEVMNQKGLHISKIIKEPMEGLIAYHKNR